MSLNQIAKEFEFCSLIGCCCCNRNLQEQKMQAMYMRDARSGNETENLHRSPELLLSCIINIWFL